MKTIRVMMVATAAAILALAGCAQATKTADPVVDNTPKTVVLADFSSGLGSVTVTMGYHGLSTVSGALATSGDGVLDATHTAALKFTYGTDPVKTAADGVTGFGQTNVLIPLTGVDFSKYTKLSFDVKLVDQKYAGWYPVLRGSAASASTWNDGWEGKEQNNDATGDAKAGWVTMTMNLTEFKSVGTNWGSTTTQTTLSGAFKNYPNLDINVVENGYDNSTTNNDGNLKTGYITNIKMLP